MTASLKTFGGRHSTEVAFALHTQPPWVRFLVLPRYFQIQNYLMSQRFINSSALLSVWTVHEMLNSWSNPSTTINWQASATKREWLSDIKKYIPLNSSSKRSTRRLVLFKNHVARQSFPAQLKAKTIQKLTKCKPAWEWSYFMSRNNPANIAAIKAGKGYETSRRVINNILLAMVLLIFISSKIFGS